MFRSIFKPPDNCALNGYSYQMQQQDAYSLINYLLRT